MSSPILLAVESSCDETAVAILEGFGTLRAASLYSQAVIHSRYGGVVPEVASRNHLAKIPDILEDALAAAGVSCLDIDAFAATIGPGLPAALLVGVAVAKGLAIGSRKPFIAVNHIEGHLLSPFFGARVIPPHIGLVVSGGHTLLVDVAGFRRYELLGTTQDDAAGEAFDKVAKLLGLPYPGGIEIDRLAMHGDPSRYNFPRAMQYPGNFQFSFSGLKTAVRYLLQKESVGLSDACASFQEAVVDVLVAKALAACVRKKKRLLSVSGGVSSNSRLRAKLIEEAPLNGIEVRFADPHLRTDNAPMIAFAAAHRLAAGLVSPLDTDIEPTLGQDFFERAGRMDRQTT